MLHWFYRLSQFLFILFVLTLRRHTVTGIQNMFVLYCPSCCLMLSTVLFTTYQDWKSWIQPRLLLKTHLNKITPTTAHTKGYSYNTHSCDYVKKLWIRFFCTFRSCGSFNDETLKWLKHLTSANMSLFRLNNYWLTFCSLY